MVNQIKQRGVVGKDGKIEVRTPEIPEGTVVEVTIRVEEILSEQPEDLEQVQDTTDYLLSSAANRERLLASLQQLESERGLIRFTPEEWDEEHSIHS